MGGKPKHIYVFPLTTNKAPFNNYVVCLADALSEKYIISNKKQKKNIGLFEIVKYLNSDAFIFNWPENIYKLKFGYLQLSLYFFAVLILKLFNKKVFWIMHNKYPHTGKNFISKCIMKFTAAMANKVITHSLDGVDFYKREFGMDNILYLEHPVYPDSKLFDLEEKYDLIIWGKIVRYKNILEFLFFAKNAEVVNKMKILICGECEDLIYTKELTDNLGDNVTFINKYLTSFELNTYISSSKRILFTYNSDSLLSSGALVYSLPFKKHIIGPNLGSFKDYAALKLISTYKTFDDITQLLSDFILDKDLMEQHNKLNSWDGFALKFMELI